MPGCEEAVRALLTVGPTVEEETHDHPEPESYEQQLASSAEPRLAPRLTVCSRRPRLNNHGHTSSEDIYPLGVCISAWDGRVHTSGRRSLAGLATSIG